ncbi:hypothetical protein LCGC14_1451630 [marine sediment metagenome]|uniref:Uncharacterized protein n=1 Tax=marine sediment metagenome TaxID=412755 RepID=A0A0F9K433_9ZZZZ
MAVDLETTYVALLLECGPPRILTGYAPPAATVGDAANARDWYTSNNIGGSHGMSFHAWWSGYKGWFIENSHEQRG